MAKPLFQDIIPPDRRSIQKIPVPNRQQPAPGYSRPQPSRPVRRPEPVHEDPEAESEIPISRATSRQQRLVDRVIRPLPQDEDEIREEERYIQRPPIEKRRWSKKWYILPVILILIAIGIYLAIPKLSGARVIVTPQQQQVSIDSQFTATKEANSIGLQFQTVTISKDGKLGVTANGEEFVQVKASGTIVIYNSFSSASQKLIASTRFATPEGLVFRITQPVVVPGAKIENGQTVPGSVEAIVTADAVGAQYNVGLTDFTIPGFKGDPKYTKIYARSKVPMQGGFSGNRRKLDDAQVKEAQEKIKAELKTSLVRQAEKDIPSDSVLPTDAYYIEYELLPNTQTADNQVQLNVRATYHGFLFKKEALAAEISKKANGSITSPGNIAGIENLTFIMKDGDNPVTWKGSTIAFSLRGTATIASYIDTEKLQNELVGKPRKSLNAILASYPGVAKAEVIMRPFWKTVFPERKEDISIELTLKQ